MRGQVLHKVAKSAISGRERKVMGNDAGSFYAHGCRSEW